MKGSRKRPTRSPFGIAWDVPFQLTEDRQAIVRIAVLKVGSALATRGYARPWWTRLYRLPIPGWMVAVALDLGMSEATDTAV